MRFQIQSWNGYDFDYGNEVHSTAQEDLGPHECLPAPECLEDRPKPQQQELVQVELEPENVKQTRHVFISADLSVEERTGLVSLLSEFKDVFSWYYSEMPGIDEDVVVHRLNVMPNAKPIKQQERVFNQGLEEKIV